MNVLVYSTRDNHKITRYRIGKIIKKTFLDLKNGDYGFLERNNLDANDVILVAEVKSIQESDLIGIISNNQNRWYESGNPLETNCIRHAVQGWFSRLELFYLFLEKLENPNYVIIYKQEVMEKKIYEYPT